MLEREDVVALFDDEHRERRDDVEARYKDDKREEDVGDELFDVHDVEHLSLLFHTVLDGKFAFADVGEFGLRALDVGAGLKLEFECGGLAFLLEEVLRESEVGEEQVFVVFPLVDVEDHSGAFDVLDGERLDGVGKVDAFSFARCADLQRTVVWTSHLRGKSYAGNAVVDLAAA